ncbi:MAG: Crp/Fnr family transcriptional regulator [Nitrospirota bacterium]
MHKKSAASAKASENTLADDVLSSFFSKVKNEGYDGGGTKAYPARAEVFKQEASSNMVYLIEQGLVKLVRVAPNGSQIIIGIRRRPWLVGAPAVFLNKPYSFTAVTLLPSAIRAIPAKSFLKLATTNKQFSSYLHGLLSQEIFNHMRNVESVSCMSAEDRVMRFLSDLIAGQASSENKRVVFSLPLTNRELAELIAVTPEHICRVLKTMERKGLIRRERGMLTVEDPAELSQGTSL